jgi:hypothetical protein
VRVASLVAASGLERALAAAPLAAALAACQALALGLIGAGSEQLALAGAALLTWLVSRLLPAPERSLTAEVVEWWGRKTTGGRVISGALAGLLAAWAAWNLHRPDVGIDGSYYHLPEVIAWVHNGQPGSDLPIHSWLDVGSYPLAHETLLAWSMGISRSLVPLGLIGVALLPLLGTGVWVALRSFGVARFVRWLVVAVVLTVPFLVTQVDGPAVDVPALAWLACAAGLAAAAQERPPLLCFMLIAAGLAIGSKTTVLPLTAVLVAVVLWRDRGRLRPLAWPLAASALLAAVVGATWYVRTLIEHGSPFWPFAATPWGDPVPPVLDSYRSLLSAPRETLDNQVSNYITALSGGWLTLGAAVVAFVWAPHRRVLAGSALVAASVLLWSSAPTTGISDFPALSASVSQTRYLFPTLALAALVLAVSTTRGGTPARIAVAVLAITVAWNVAQVASGDFPNAFSNAWLAAGASTGAVLALAAGRLPKAVRPESWRLRTALGAATLVAGAAVLAAAASGYTARYAAHTRNFDGPVVREFQRPPFSVDRRPVAMAPEIFGMLAGDDLDRRVELIPVDESCASVRRRRARAWVITRNDPVLRSELGYKVDRCLADARPLATAGAYRVYGSVSAP